MPLWADDADGNGEYGIGAVFADDADGNGEYEIGAIYADDADGNGEYLVWEDGWIEDFEHNDLSGRYGSFTNFDINSTQPYTGSYSLEAPNSSGGEKAFADTSQFSDTVVSGESYRSYIYVTTDSSSRRARMYVASNGQDPSSGDGYRIFIRNDDLTLLLEAWSGGTLIESDSSAINSIPTGQWDYFEFSYANADDAGGSTFAVDYVTGGSVEASVSTGTTVESNDDWGFEKPDSWATHYFGGIERV